MTKSKIELNKRTMRNDVLLLHQKRRCQWKFFLFLIVWPISIIRFHRLQVDYRQMQRFEVDDFFLVDVSTPTEEKKQSEEKLKTKFSFIRLTFATLIPLQKSSLPSIGKRCNLEKIFPTSDVNCVTTRPLKIDEKSFRRDKKTNIFASFYSESVNKPT